jgi:hypothetical protein
LLRGWIGIVKKPRFIACSFRGLLTRADRASFVIS